MKGSVFISYAHMDKEYLDRILVHLKPYEREYKLDVWSDAKLTPGQEWAKEIEGAIDSASVAILLFSADFLASEFIHSKEIPPLLAAAESKGLCIIPVILKPCAFTSIQYLSKYQAVNDPTKPIVSMSEFEREEQFSKLSLIIKNKLEFQESTQPDNSSEKLKYVFVDVSPFNESRKKIRLNYDKCENIQNLIDDVFMEMPLAHGFSYNISWILHNNTTGKSLRGIDLKGPLTIEACGISTNDRLKVIRI
jgi:hypothetical protein